MRKLQSYAVGLSGAEGRLPSLLQHLSLKVLGTNFSARADQPFMKPGLLQTEGFAQSTTLTVFAGHVSRPEAHLL